MAVKGKKSCSLIGGLKTMSDEQKMGQEYKLRPDTIIIVGSARLPENTTAKHVFGYVTVELEIDPLDARIVDVSCVSLPFLVEKILHTALLGKKIDQGIRDSIEQLDRRFFGITRKAVIAALEDAYRRYKKVLEEKGQMVCRLPIKEVASLGQ